MIDKDNLIETGKRKGIKNKGFIEKDYFQDLFLFNLYKKTNNFVFKGGTALYKLNKLPRFSEDLDFSLVENIEINEMREMIERASENCGFKLRSIKKTKESLMIKIDCPGLITKHNSLRIDIHTKNEIISGFDVVNHVSEYVDIPPFVLRVLKMKEIVAEKIHSLLNRRKARDLFDLFYLLRSTNLNDKLINKKLALFNLKYDLKLIEKKINELEELWKPELEAFVLTELPDFEVVKNFILMKLKAKRNNLYKE